MTKENQKIYFLALFMVICAVFLRVIGKETMRKSL